MAANVAQTREKTARGSATFITAEAFVPRKKKLTLPLLRKAAATCKGCDLYQRATQTVFGQGKARARVVLVGETPGDREDIEGAPFVGPSGALLDRALAEAGIARSDAYVTNAVKHFKWTPAPRGKRRIHARPSVGQIRACTPWLEHELEIIRPAVLVCLGATASRALLGSSFRVTRSRGEPVRDSSWAPVVVATVHPSAVLRAPDDQSRRREYDDFVRDLRVAAKHLGAAQVSSGA